MRSTHPPAHQPSAWLLMTTRGSSSFAADSCSACWDLCVTGGRSLPGPVSHTQQGWVFTDARTLNWDLISYWTLNHKHNHYTTTWRYNDQLKCPHSYGTERVHTTRGELQHQLRFRFIQLIKNGQKQRAEVFLDLLSDSRGSVPRSSQF